MAGFGSGLFTAPNTIDFGSVFNNIGQKIIDNIHVIATIVVLILLYIPCTVLCRRMDQKDNMRVGVIFLYHLYKSIILKQVLLTFDAGLCFPREKNLMYSRPDREICEWFYDDHMENVFLLLTVPIKLIFLFVRYPSPPPPPVNHQNYIVLCR